MPPSSLVHPWPSGVASSTAGRLHAAPFEYPAAASMASPERPQRPDPPSSSHTADHPTRRSPPARRSVWTVPGLVASTSGSSSATVSGLSSSDPRLRSTPSGTAEATGGDIPAPGPPAPATTPGGNSTRRAAHSSPPVSAATAAGAAAGGDPLIGASVPASTPAAQTATQQFPLPSDTSVDGSFHTTVPPPHPLPPGSRNPILAPTT